MRLPAFICLCVSKITQKCVHGLTFKPNLDYSPDNNNNNKQIYKAPCMPTAGCRGAERPEPDCFLRYHMRCNTQFYYIGENPSFSYWAPVAAARRGLFTASRGNNFVGGTCTPLSAILVAYAFPFKVVTLAHHFSV